MIRVSHQDDAGGAATVINTSAELSEVLQKDIQLECDGLLSEYMSPRLKKKSGPSNIAECRNEDQDEDEPPPEMDEEAEIVCEEDDDEEEEDGDEGLDELIMIDEAEQEEREKKLAGSEDAEMLKE